MSGWIEYDSNNSGGGWWLNDTDWKALEEAGWHVDWIVVTSRESSFSTNPFVSASSGRRYGETWEEATRPFTPGTSRWDTDSMGVDETVVAAANTFEEALTLRGLYGDYMEALAVSAVKQGESAAELVEEFERLTGQSASDLGCSCCGPPHSFVWHNEDGSTEIVESRLEWS